ncbi:hypothetical protein GCM10010286_24010 [Streptomyces toxytricini]|nr:hypothetical protein GCM10010286_24010 [Streptomyces toxytricini]
MPAVRVLRQTGGGSAFAGGGQAVRPWQQGRPGPSGGMSRGLHGGRAASPAGALGEPGLHGRRPVRLREVVPAYAYTSSVIRTVLLPPAAVVVPPPFRARPGAGADLP